MNCPKCSYKLTLLFTGTACDKCDGLLKQETAQDAPSTDDVARYCYTTSSFSTYKNHDPFVFANELMVFDTRQAALDDMNRYRSYVHDLVLLTVFGGRPRPVHYARASSISAIWNETQRTSPDQAVIIFHECV